MNAEEGELRPQLLDRFGLGVEVRGSSDPAVRAEIVRRRLAFERDPAAFVRRYEADERALAERVALGREQLERVRLPERELMRIAGACARLGVDGVRGDIVSARAACALAALESKDEVEEQHVRRAAELALAHPLRPDPLQRGRSPEDGPQPPPHPPHPPPPPPHPPPPPPPPPRPTPPPPPHPPPAPPPPLPPPPPPHTPPPPPPPPPPPTHPSPPPPPPPPPPRPPHRPSPP